MLKGCSQVETSPLRSRGFLLLWLSYAVTTLGGWLQTIAVSVWIYERSGSALAVGASFALRQLPAAAMGWLGGVLSDRYDRRKVIICGIIMKAAAALYLVVLGDGALLAVVMLVGALSSGGESLMATARSVTLPMVVEKEGVLRANSILYGTGNFITLVGALAGGMLTAAWGIYRLCATNLACLGVSAVLVACIRLRDPLQISSSHASRPHLPVSLRDGGTTYLRDHSPLIVLIAAYAM
jgi:MFS family permease